MPRKLTTQQFIEKAQVVHGDKYDYSLVSYVNNKTKVKIICKEHGVFEQTPNNHLNYGCKFCGGTQLMDNESFIDSSNTVHNNFYDYSNVIYLNSSTEVTINCPIHGNFKQTPNSHISGHGCRNCGYDKTTKYKKISKEEFLLKAYEKHSNRFDYSITNYTDYNSSINIICKEHGIVSIKAKNHLIGEGCKKCTNKLKSINNHIKTNTKQKIKQLQSVHQNKYSYNKVTEIENYNSFIKIEYPLHGEFEQKYNSHRRGHGCNKCAKNNFYGYYSIKNAERNKEEWLNITANLYVLIVNDEFIKIGISKNVNRRIKEHRYNFIKIEKLYTLESNLYNMVLIERKVNNYLTYLKINYIKDNLKEIYKISKKDLIINTINKIYNEYK